MIELPKRGGGTHVIDAAQIASWQRDYPHIDVDLELRKARNWLEANPERRKTRINAFVVNWLNRARPQNPNAVTPGNSKHYAVIAERSSRPTAYQPPSERVVETELQKVRRQLGMRV